MRDINGKSVALLGRRPPHFSTGIYKLLGKNLFAGRNQAV